MFAMLSFSGGIPARCSGADSRFGFQRELPAAARFNICEILLQRGSRTIVAVSQAKPGENAKRNRSHRLRSEEHTSELQSLMRISYAVFCLKKKKNKETHKKRRTS